LRWGFERGEDGVSEPGPGCGLEAELGAAFGSEGVKLRASIVFRGTPFGGDPAADLEAVEGGVEGAFFYLKDVIGRALDPACDAIAVGRAPADGLEDEEVERAAKDFDGGLHKATPIEFLGGEYNGRFP
jgi:hypothetical protein